MKSKLIAVALVTVLLSIVLGNIFACTPTPTVQYDLTISSTAGGWVIEPGEGTFTYDEGTMVYLVADPYSDYEFVQWTGDVDDIADIEDATTSITMNGEGVSRFSGGMVRFDYEDYAPPAAPLGVSDTANAETLLFLTFPVGWVGEWHAAPRKQFVFVLAGRIEVEVGDGEKREFGPGDVILALDTAGRGHISRTVGKQPAISAAVAIGN